jgi:rhodanese-related sulfurtransferase
MTVQNEAPVKATVKTITKEALKARLAEATTPVLLDVRSQEEFDAGHIEGAILIPVDRLEERIAELQQNKDAEIIVYCHTGRRSTRAAEILAGNGFSNITNFTGGWSAWSE